MTEKTSEKLNAIHKFLESTSWGVFLEKAWEKNSKTNDQGENDKIAILDLPLLR